MMIMITQKLHPNEFLVDPIPLDLWINYDMSPTQKVQRYPHGVSRAVSPWNTTPFVGQKSP